MKPSRTLASSTQYIGQAVITVADGADMAPARMAPARIIVTVRAHSKFGILISIVRGFPIARIYTAQRLAIRI